jgi:hypothetical protein
MSAHPRHPPRITFTHDHHELVRGDLLPGTRVRLRYDPLRIVPADEGYIFGDPDRPVMVHAVFRPGNPPVNRTLHSPAGMLTHPDIDATGNGSMLDDDLDIPADATQLELWFTFAGRGGLCVDADGGRNFRFGFTGLEFAVLDTNVKPAPGGAAFSARVRAAPEVDRVTVRMRAVNRDDVEKRDLDLQKTGAVESGWPVWSVSGIGLPAGTILRVKFHYWIAGIRYKDDNHGLYYSAPPPPSEHVPPPPAELAAAAKEWT